MKLFLGVLLWIVLLPVSLVVLLVSYVLAPFIVLTASKDGWLPVWLNWFQTPDNSLDGDAGWKEEHWQWRFKFSPRLATYAGRVGWLLRNPAYGFDTDVIAAKQPLENFKYYGNKLISNTPPVVDGWLIVTSGYYWNVYVILPSVFGKTFRLYLGWKLRNGEGLPFYQYVAYCNPFKFRG